MDPGLYEQRPPTDLANPRLRKLAAALAPAYMRVSGTWANTTYFHDSDAPPPSTPPKGFSGVLTRQQWKGVIDFAHAADAKLVSSFATSPGTRDAHGVWTPKEARKLLSYTKSVGGAIAAAEFMNEPTAAAMGGAPKGYDAAAYGRDLAVFRPFIKEAAPDLTILGPGSVGEGTALSDSMSTRMPFIKSEDLLAAAGPVFDAFSYHFYGAVSNRCAALGAAATTTADAALSQEWLARTDRAEEFYQGLRDRFEPGKPLWITETADAACGGNPWASTFLDSFRYLDQLGRLAKRGVQVIAHNTLAASDYGLLDETFLHAATELLGGAAMAEVHGPYRARCRRRAGRAELACLCALLTRRAGRGRDAGHQYGSSGSARPGTRYGNRSLHAHCAEAGRRHRATERDRTEVGRR